MVRPPRPAAILAQVAAQSTLSVLIYQRTHSPLPSALVFALGFVPYLLGAVLLGAVADRFPVRPVMVATQCVSAGFLACMAVPGLPFLVLLLLLMVNGTIAPIFQGARAAALPDLLPGGGYPLGRALLRIAVQTAQIAGFAFGGMLLTLVPTTTALLVAAGAMAASGLVLRLGVRARPARNSASTGGGSIVGHSVAGVATAFRLPLLRCLLLFAWLPPALAVAPEALVVAFVGRMGGGPALTGILLCAWPTGMILGNLLVGVLFGARLRDRCTVPMALVVFAPLPLFLLDPGATVIAVLLVVSGTGFGYLLGLDRRILDAIPDDARGRVLALASAGLMLAQGLGFAAAGAAAEFFAPHRVVAAAGVAGLVLVLTLGRVVSTRSNR
ncbi:MFS transporter [Nocardiopsis ansamitocini]|uniref:MFS transporter n=1 Tax=Nocardiopsis ansamitocini TaxID=1670832 RepID=A0A9W6PAH6_9ACTN|nr:MFS transporter [Nocardiopsis ansamitocini]GLU50111.1 MFS transporter [Nocardiopsis ansamitocini]